jgi:pyruvate dehydrogenase (quinone)
VPVLAIAAHIPRAEIGSDYFQETRPQELFRGCSVYCELASIAEQLPGVLEMAIRAALQRRGVAVVVVPGEVFVETAPAGAQARPIRTAAAVMKPAEADLAAAADLLNAASGVTILAGAGCAGAHEELTQLAGALKAPIVHAFRGKDAIEYDNPYDVGMTGLIGFSSGYRAMEHCDALLMLGTDFPYRPFLPKSIPVIQVDVRGENIGRRVPVDVPLVGTVADTIRAMLPLITVKQDAAHMNRMRAHYQRARSRLDELAADRSAESPLHPQFIAATIDRIAAPDAIFAADVGTPCVWAARYVRMNGRRRMIGSFNHGSMANALPKVIVFNNGALSFVELEMKAAGIVTYGTDLINPDFAAIAAAAGMFSARVERADQLADALDEAFAHGGPALVDVATVRHELALPPKLSFGELKGFTLYATRTILSGGGEELLELAKSNLRQVEAE